ncbi:MarR family winged helix-turn-helix transcriptional regulator [Parasphingorhabdus pacifica]
MSSPQAAHETASTPNDTQVDDQIVSWWGLVIEGYHATQGDLLGEIADRLDLTPASFDIVVRLLRSPGYRLPMSRLAKETALSIGGFTKAADRLAAANLIRREPHETDRRVIYTVLSDHGLRVAEEARRVCAEILRERVLRPLGREQAADLAEAMRVLRAVNRPS